MSAPEIIAVRTPVALLFGAALLALNLLVLIKYDNAVFRSEKEHKLAGYAAGLLDECTRIGHGIRAQHKECSDLFALTRARLADLESKCGVQGW
jgi:hypothetical protein